MSNGKEHLKSVPMTIIHENDDRTVGLARLDDGYDLTEHDHVMVDPELLIEFAEQCKQMDWDEITMYHGVHDAPVFACERDDESGMFAILAPIIPDPDNEGGETDV